MGFQEVIAKHMIMYILLILSSFLMASFIALVLLSLNNFKFKTYDKRLAELDNLLEQLIRRRMMEFGFLGQFKKAKMNQEKEVLDKCKTLKVMESIILRNKNQGVSSDALLMTYDLLLSIHERKVGKLKEIKMGIENFTRSPLSSSFLLEHLRVLLNSDLFLISETEEVFMPFKEILHVSGVYTFMFLLIEDALKNNATVSKKMEKIQNTSCKQIFKTVEYLILLKAGASSKVLMDEIVLKQNWDVARLRNMTETQKHTAVMSIIRKDYRVYKTYNEITQEILDTIKKMNKLRNEYLHDNFKADQQYDEKMKRENEHHQKAKDKKQRHQEEKERFYNQHNNQQKDSEQKIYAGNMELNDAYHKLGLDPNCSIRKIKRNYKDLAMKKHPDRQLNIVKETEKKRVHDEFIEIKNAYDKLMKHHKKAA